MISSASTTFQFDVFRIGWYGGAGNRQVLSVGLRGHNQGYWIPDSFGVVGCPTCKFDPSTGLLDLNWSPSYSLTIPSNWVSGSYFAKLSTLSGDRAYIYFVVRQDSRPSSVLIVMPVNTYQAYNDWGGASLYTIDGHGRGSSEAEGPELAQKRAFKVSFNRPYNPHTVDPTFQDFQLSRLLEREGFDIAYATDVDLDRNPVVPLRHRVYVSLGHDEYWSRQMWRNVQSARDSGVNLAFFGGNDVYRQVRYEPDSQGRDRRTLVCYKSAALDPVAAIDPANATLEFINPPLNRPQNALTGTLFNSGFPPSGGIPWVVAAGAPSWFLAGTGLVTGDSVPGLIAYECDQAMTNSAQPASLQIIASSTFTTADGKRKTCDSTLYLTAHHSQVFSAGTMGWTLEFGNPKVMRMTKNILNRFTGNA